MMVSMTMVSGGGDGSDDDGSGGDDGGDDDGISGTRFFTTEGWNMYTHTRKEEEGRDAGRGGRKDTE